MMKPATVEGIKKIYYDNLKQMRHDLTECLKIAEFVPIWFGGKAIFYHHKALLEAKKGFLEDEHLMMVREALIAFGMASRGADLLSIDDFKKPILKHKSALINMKSKFRSKRIDRLTKPEIDELVELMLKIKVNRDATETRIVSASKALHHILPHTIPPIDRQYSLRFMTRPYKSRKFYDDKTIPINPDEVQLAQIFIEGMRDFYNTEEGKHLVSMELVKPNPQVAIVGSFNTSLPKVFDNLIVAFVLLYHTKFSM